MLFVSRAVADALNSALTIRRARDMLIGTDVCRSVFANAFDPQSPYFWGLAPSTKATQLCVEAALVAWSLGRLGDDFVATNWSLGFDEKGQPIPNPAKHPHVKAALGQAFIDWLLSRDGQDAIASYKIGGEQLFFPNANTPGA